MAGCMPTCAKVTATHRKWETWVPCALVKLGSREMPTRAAASAHWVFRCSVGATTVMRRTVPSDSRLAAICSAKVRSEEHTSELQSRGHLVCRLLLEKKKANT